MFAENNSLVNVISVKALPNSSRLLVVFDNEESYKIYTDIVLKFGICKGKSINQLEMELIFSEQETMDCKQTAYNYASYTFRTEFAVRKQLKDKNFSLTAIDTAIQFLYQFNLLDDIKYAQKFVKDILKRKSIGKSKIKLELLKKGIDIFIAESALADSFPEEDTFSIALTAAEKKKKLVQKKPLDKQKNAVYNYLVYQGFDFSTARLATKQIFSMNNDSAEEYNFD